MDKQKDTLLCASAFFFGCVALDIIQLIIGLVNGSFQFGANTTGLTEAQANIAVTLMLVILLVIGSIGTIIKLFLAVKGLRQAKGQGGKGTSHITWAKVIAVLLVISVIGSISSVANGEQHWYTLISPIVSLVATYFYIKSATALKA